MKLIVLLAAYNGEDFLRAQLDSLPAQSLDGLEILVRDDGSSDGTHRILTEYAQSGALRWYAGKHLGAGRSFWQLLQDAGEAEYYAFCDQDDVWDSDKLEIAVSMLSSLDSSKPALYCGDVRVTDAALHVLSEHLVRPAPVDYPHALIRNLSPGCTYVFNRTARELLRRYDAERLGMELHDWTAYQIAACLGTVVYDPVPHMCYRQHGNNVIGAHRSAAGSCLKKAVSFWSGPMKNSRERQALRLEQCFGQEMCAEYRELTALLAHYRENREAKKELLSAIQTSVTGADGLFASLLALMNRL